ncbi:probable E3 ubiquitin-protein ligase HERC4 isoform X2 [Nilaparvata lugens]|uniref:probable E3 ubiquitin-protein ligase HERC4 isoform X2 n=1 Tax=Nilaparvata lugens TaxID=108931 RepID=UPI00193DD5A2|nr:probable E3 ubiquitin-protein ligase HERC4 isoform X2 [Nilaparvata lugens]
METLRSVDSSPRMNCQSNGFCLSTTTASMFCWGNTTNGELGLGGIEDQHILVPRELNFKEANKVHYVACGKSHSVLITESGQIFSCGSNDFGQLGHSKPQTRFEEVDRLNNYVITKVSCGDHHSAAANEWGEVYTWGKNSHGQLGYLTAENLNEPKIVKHIATCFVVQISCGSNHCLALTNSGDLYSWGANEWGQLGIGHKTNLHIPTKIPYFAGIPLAFIASGDNHSFALSKSGAVFGWGKNCFGQLGLNSDQNQSVPTNLKTLRSIRVKYIACGEDFSVFLTQDGGVFTCGAGQYGQLGHGSLSNEILPRKVLELMGSTVTQISCGRRHTLAFVPSRGRVYAFGLGGAGQLGSRAVLNSNTPQVVLGPWLSPSGVALLPPPASLSSDYVIRRIFAGGDHCFVTVRNQQENIPPEDFRVFQADSQISALTIDRIIECQSLQPDSHVPDDLITYLETVMGSVACINGSFLASETESFSCPLDDHGLDMEQVKQCFEAISRIEHQSVNDIINEYIFDRVMKSLHPSTTDVETLRIYLILPLFHQFVNAKNSGRLQGPFGTALLNLKPEATKIVGLWYRRMTAEYFERLIRIYQNVLLLHLQPPYNSDKTNVHWNENMEIALEVLNRLNQLNQLTQNKNMKKNENFVGLKVPHDTFYLPELTEKVDLRVDYVRWALEKQRHLQARRYFCNFPFLFDAEAKLSILQTDQSLQMQSAMQEAATQAFTQYLFTQIINPSASQFLELHVTRQNIVNDTLQGLASSSEKDYKKPLKVTFVGEEAEDAGGVRKEFFMLLLKEILDPKYGMFRSYEETNTIWFSESSFEDEAMYYLIGLLCGLVIYNFTIISLPFPLALYKKLLGEPVTLQDVADLSPVMAKSLQDLLDYNLPDVEDVFCLSFEVTREIFGEIKSYELKPGGKSIPVTSENKQEYVDSYVDFILNSSVQRHYRAFHHAFHKVCGGHVLKLFHAQELMAVIVGNECYDWDEFESSASYKGGYTSSDATIRLFWEVFHEMSQEDKRKFLLFLTGSDRVPIQGMKGIKIFIQPTSDSAYLPVAHTCFNLLDLPRYGTKEKLRYKLLQAIQQNVGFSLI